MGNLVLKPCFKSKEHDVLVQDFRREQSLQQKIIASKENEISVLEKKLRAANSALSEANNSLARLQIDNQPKKLVLDGVNIVLTLMKSLRAEIEGFLSIVEVKYNIFDEKSEKIRDDVFNLLLYDYMEKKHQPSDICDMIKNSIKPFLKKEFAHDQELKRMVSTAVEFHLNMAKTMPKAIFIMKSQMFDSKLHVVDLPLQKVIVHFPGLMNIDGTVVEKAIVRVVQ
jgi:hypothetical protein